MNIMNLFAAVDLCASSPCLSNQNCTSVGDNYYCNCFPGYTGEVCQTGKPIVP